jgi:hypothetical protein
MPVPLSVPLPLSQFGAEVLLLQGKTTFWLQKKFQSLHSRACNGIFISTYPVKNN